MPPCQVLPSSSQTEGVLTSTPMTRHVVKSFWSDPREEINVLVRVEPRHFVGCTPVGFQYVEVFLKSIIRDQVVSHFDPVWFHRMDYLDKGSVFLVSYASKSRRRRRSPRLKAYAPTSSARWGQRGVRWESGERGRTIVEVSDFALVRSTRD